jgi:7-alpha-hydroxysteroid dehydrogenase
LSEKVLKDKVAVVTGASRGIGKGIALEFADAGANVVVTGRTVPDLELTAAEIEARGARSLVVKMDAFDYTQVEAAIDESVSHFGQIDVLVNNAGGSRNVENGWVGLMDAGVETVDAVFRLHVSSPYVAARKAAAAMIERGQGGSIINITSAFAQYPSERVQNYSAAKVALNEMTKLWAVELGRHKIRVNAICPGTTRSATLTKLLPTPEAEAEAVRTIPMGRLGEPSDMGKCAVFLASDAGEWVSGASILISGGWRY